MHKCPICNKKLHLLTSKYNENIDYICRQNDHFFGRRFVNDKLIIMKLRVLDNKEKIFLKIYFDENRTEIWKNELFDVIHIKKIIEIQDFSLSAILNKIKTLYIFS